MKSVGMKGALAAGLFATALVVGCGDGINEGSNASGGSSSSASSGSSSRCDAMSGTEREQCLREQRSGPSGSGSGGTASPSR